MTLIDDSTRYCYVYLLKSKPSGFLCDPFFYRFNHLEVGVIRHGGEGWQRSEKEVTGGEIRIITVKKKEKAKQATKEERASV